MPGQMTYGGYSTRIVVDENYVRESVLAPGAKLVEGYEDVMPRLAIEERDLLGIIAYLQTLKEGP